MTASCQERWRRGGAPHPALSPCRGRGFWEMPTLPSLRVRGEGLGMGGLAGRWMRAVAPSPCPLPLPGCEGSGRYPRSLRSVSGEMGWGWGGWRDGGRARRPSPCPLPLPGARVLGDTHAPFAPCPGRWVGDGGFGGTMDAGGGAPRPALSPCRGRGFWEIPTLPSLRVTGRGVGDGGVGGRWCARGAPHPALSPCRGRGFWEIPTLPSLRVRGEGLGMGGLAGRWMRAVAPLTLPSPPPGARVLALVDVGRAGFRVPRPGAAATTAGSTYGFSTQVSENARKDELPAVPLGFVRVRTSPATLWLLTVIEAELQGQMTVIRSHFVPPSS